ncbi:MAG: HNH endonuclease signature motif containing protein [Romboutsia timonensis]
MIKIENIEVFGWDTAIRGARNPMNSWDRMDSGYNNGDFFIGEKDYKMLKGLCIAGTDHRKWMRMVNVTMDITAPMYWWSEYDTYKVGTVANSTSKMHKMLAKPFEMQDFSFDKLFGYKNEVKQFIPEVDRLNEKWIEIQYGYKVSNQGRIKNPQGRILGGSTHKNFYRFVTIKGKQIPIHRLVAENFIENKENKPFINHKDGNKMNNSVDNLEWVTQAENIQHSYENNLQPKPVKTYKGKFTEEQRQQIKREYNEENISKRQLAIKYKVSHTCINDIVNDKYKYADKINVYEEVARPLVDTLNELRDCYFRCDDETTKKKIWYEILQLLPNSYNQKRTVQLNYEVLNSMWHARKSHKLDEWREFCDIVEDCLPYSEFITKKFEEVE